MTPMRERINVLSLRNVVAFGGPDTTLLGWYRRIDRDRFDVSLATLENEGDADRQLVAPLRELGVRTSSVPYGRYKNVPGALHRLCSIIRTDRIHILHTHDHRSDVLGYFAARWTGVPVMSTIYVWFSEHSTGKVKYLEALQRVFLRRFDGITAISEATRRDTVERYGFPADRVTTLLSGIDVERFSGPVDVAAVRASLGVGPDDRLMPYVARLWPEKAHRYLLRALAIVLAEEPRAKLLVVGDGVLRGDLEQQARELGIAGNVVFTGIRRDVPDLLRVSEFLVHPSLAEGIALAIYEGMAAGLAVVGTSVDGTPEVVTHERTGLLVPPKDVDALAAAMLRLLRDRELATRMGAAARELMAGDYSLSRATRRLEDYYRRLWRGRRGEA